MAELNASVVLDLVDRISRPIRRIEERFARLGQSQGLQKLRQSMAGVGEQWAGVTDQAGRLTSRLAMIGGAAAVGGYAFKRLFVDTASQFEQFRTVLETLEGSSAKAEQSMRWISRFAARTPYELSQVTDAYVRLRAYGLDPTTGLLKTLGDTAASMNKPLLASVEAMADAVNGEYERLKEFGITSMTQGTRTAFQYINASGEQITKVVDNRNKAMISSTLEAIWSSRYGGAMQKLSGTWGGMINNLADQWTRFANLVMDSGVFEWMKTRLRELLDRIDAMAASGELKTLAKRLGADLVKAFKQFYQAARAIGGVLQKIGRALAWTADLLGGWGRLVGLVAAILAGPLILSLVQLGLSVFGLAKTIFFLARAAMPAAIAAVRALGVALLTTPVGWIVAAIAAIAGAAYLIYKNWDAVAPWFRSMWANVVGFFQQSIGEIAKDLLAFSPAALLMKGIDAVFELFGARPLSEIGKAWIGGLADGISQRWDQLTGWLSNKMDALTGWLPDWATGGLGLDGLGSGPRLGANALSEDTVDGALGAAGMTRVGGELRISIDSQGRPQVSELRRDGPMELDVDVGDRRMWR